MTPRVVGISRRMTPPTSYEVFRHRPEDAPLENRAFWRWATTQVVDPDARAEDTLPEEEYRVLAKNSSGGAFLVPTDVEELIVGAARANSSVASTAQEFITETGTALGVPTVATHAAAAWILESGTYTPTDEVATQTSLGAFKAGVIQVVSEELRRTQSRTSETSSA
jgi:HK97 family phage major capsid protein